MFRTTDNFPKTLSLNGEKVQTFDDDEVVWIEGFLFESISNLPV